MQMEGKFSNVEAAARRVFAKLAGAPVLPSSRPKTVVPRHQVRSHIPYLRWLLGPYTIMFGFLGPQLLTSRSKRPFSGYVVHIPYRHFNR